MTDCTVFSDDRLYSVQQPPESVWQGVSLSWRLHCAVTLRLKMATMLSQCPLHCHPPTQDSPGTTDNSFISDIKQCLCQPLLGCPDSQYTTSTNMSFNNLRLRFNFSEGDFMFK